MKKSTKDMLSRIAIELLICLLFGLSVVIILSMIKHDFNYGLVFTSVFEIFIGVTISSILLSITHFIFNRTESHKEDRSKLIEDSSKLDRLHLSGHHL